MLRQCARHSTDEVVRECEVEEEDRFPHGTVDDVGACRVGLDAVEASRRRCDRQVVVIAGSEPVDVEDDLLARLVGDLDHLLAMGFEILDTAARETARVESLVGITIEGVASVSVALFRRIAADNDEVCGGCRKRSYVVNGLAHACAVADGEVGVGDQHLIAPWGWLWDDKVQTNVQTGRTLPNISVLHNSVL